MSALQSKSNVWVSFVFILDIILFGISWVCAYGLRFYVLDNLLPPLGSPSFQSYFEFTPFLLVFAAIGLTQYNYEFFFQRKPFSELLQILKACSIVSLLFVSSSFFYRDFSFSRVFVLSFSLLSFSSLVTFRVLLRKIFLFFVLHRKFQRNALLIGGKDNAKRFLETLKNQPYFGYQVKGYIAEEENKSLKVPWLGNIKLLVDVLDKYKVEEVFIVLNSDEQSLLKEINELLAEQVVKITIVPDIYSALNINTKFNDFAGIPVITIRQTPIEGWGRVIKRALDIFVAVVTLVVGFPLWLLIAILIKSSSKGPVLFTQQRMGLDGKIFKMYKFRSMRTDLDFQSSWTVENDPRRTKVGTILRKTSLDEIPQVLNVLKGDMSLVGPRPEQPEYIEKFKKNIPNYMLRHHTKAGITGWAQVNGWRGDTSIERRVECDIYYLTHWSLLFDLWILFLTVFRGFVNKNAY